MSTSDEAADLRDLFDMAKDEEFGENANAFLLNLKARGHKDFSKLSPAQRKWVDDLVKQMQARS